MDETAFEHGRNGQGTSPKLRVNMGELQAASPGKKNVAPCLGQRCAQAGITTARDWAITKK